MMNKRVVGLFIALTLSGCSSLHQSESVEKNELPTVNENKEVLVPENKVEKEENIFLKQSKNLKIKDDSVYYLNSINNGSIPLMDTPVTLIFIEEEGLKNVAKGFSGCNDYYFKYKISNNVFVLGEVVTTNFKCEKPEAKFENFLFKELGKNPNIRMNNEYVVIKGFDKELLWKKKNSISSPKSARKVITSSPKKEINDEFEGVEIMDDFKEEDIVHTKQKVRKEEVKRKYYNNHKGITVTKYNINDLHIYKKSLSRTENISIRNKAVVIKNKLGGESRIVNLNLENGDTIPLIEYKINRKDTLKKIILTTYPSGKNPKWVELIERLNQVASLNTRVKNIDHIYPHQKIYIPVFQN